MAGSVDILGCFLLVNDQRSFFTLKKRSPQITYFTTRLVMWAPRKGSFEIVSINALPGVTSSLAVALELKLAPGTWGTTV